MSEMKIELIRLVGSYALGLVMKHCWGAFSIPPKHRLYASNDSILEVEEFLALCEIPRSVAMQLETHKKKHRFYCWMYTARPDLPNLAKGEYSRDQMIHLAMVFTPRAIIEISHYRMCGKAEDKTREFMRLLRKEVERIEPELARQMMPMCAFRNGLCTEMHGCGHPMTYEQGKKLEGE